MNKDKILKGIKMIWVVIAIYIALMAYMFLFQRNFTFQPSHTNPFNGDTRPFKTMTYKTPMGLNLRGLYYPAKLGMPTIVYFQGNAGDIGERIFKAQDYIKHGYGMAMVGYRGYSGNPGQPSEQGFYEDGRAVIAALESAGVKKTDMILYGESIGSGTATQMATEIPAKALILEAPFTAAPDIGARVYWFLPVHKLMKDKFDNASKIGKLSMPILIIHGTADKTVPYEYGKKLFSKVTAPVKTFVTIENAGHGDLYDYGAGDKINEFLAKL